MTDTNHNPTKPSSVLRFMVGLLKNLIWLFVAVQCVVAVCLLYWKINPVNGNSMFMLTHRFLDNGTIHQQWVDYEHISKNVKQAVIASEDSQFMSHNGFDSARMREAFSKNRQAGKIVAGGSTITQQLAKNLFLTSHRNYLRKTEEAIITAMMEQMWEKKRILTVYLNVAEFGEGIYGIEVAARYYFDKSASELSKAEAALLASMLNRPRHYQHRLNNPHLRKKQAVIMKRMPQSIYPANKTTTDNNIKNTYSLKK